MVDIATAQPGTWPVGDAGEVTFGVDDNALVLVDHQPSDGWEARIDTRDPDEIEVEFTRSGEQWEFEVEIDDDEVLDSERAAH